MQADFLDFLKGLLQQLEACESDYPSPDYLERLEIQSVQVDIADNQTIQFDPCFFQPYPEGILHKYEATDEDGRMPRLSTPTLAQVLEEVREEYSNDEEILEIAKSQHEQILEWKTFDDWYSDGRDVYSHINWHLTTLRKGELDFFCLSDLVPHRYWR